MRVFTYSGNYVASALADQLRAAGIDCQGVTATEDATGTVSAVQVICGDEVAQASVYAVVAAYTPPPTAAQVAARTAATNQATLLHERNRWLAQTDPYVLPTGSLPSDMPASVITAINANQAAILSWRQELRDYPGTVSDWTNPPPLPAPPNIKLPSGRPLIIVT